MKRKVALERISQYLSESVSDPSTPTPRQGRRLPGSSHFPHLLKLSPLVLAGHSHPKATGQGQDFAREGGVKSVKGSPSCTQTHLLPAPPNALKSQSGFVVFPGGPEPFDARSIKAAAAAVAAQSPALRVRTLGRWRHSEVLSLQRRQHSSAGTRRAKRHSSFSFSLESF